MVYGKSQSKMDDDWGYPHSFGKLRKKTRSSSKSRTPRYAKCPDSTAERGTLPHAGPTAIIGIKCSRCWHMMEKCMEHIRPNFLGPSFLWQFHLPSLVNYHIKHSISPPLIPPSNKWYFNGIHSHFKPPSQPMAYTLQFKIGYTSQASTLMVQMMIDQWIFGAFPKRSGTSPTQSLLPY